MTEQATTVAEPATIDPKVVEEVFGPEPEADTKKSDEKSVETEKSDEVATEEKPDPKVERVANRITAAKRVEIKAAQEREQSRRERHDIEKRTKDLEEREAKLKLIEEDPVRYFEETKADPKAFLHKLVGANDPAKLVDKKLTSLEQELRTEREARQKAEQQATLASQARHVEAAWRESTKAFVEHVTTNAEKFPNLVEEFTDAEAVDAAFRALTEVVGHDRSGQPVTRAEAYKIQFGEYPDDDTIAEFLDERAKARLEAREKSVWRKRTGQETAKTPPDHRGSPRTLTSRTGSQKGSGPRAWSQEAADEESLRLLRGAIREG